MVGVMLAIPNELIRLGLRIILEERGAFRVVSECSSLGAVVDTLGFDVKPDVILVDAQLVDLADLSAVRAEYPQIPIMVCGPCHESISVQALLAAGAAGVLVKHDSTLLLTALQSVAAGGIWIDGHFRTQLSPAAMRKEPADDQSVVTLKGLTARENDVLQLVCEGATNPEIALKLKISRETVKTHLTNLLRKLGARDRTHLAVLALRCTA